MDGDTTDLLQQGIAAARAGQKDTARSLLMRVVEQDERNAAAWLWLSGLVESLDDREVCLENVLALEPENPAARKGLNWIRQQKAAQVYTPPLISESSASSARPPLTPAAAILRRSPSEPKANAVPISVARERVPVAPSGSATRSSPPSLPADGEAMDEFDNEYLCPYCAAPTKPEDKRCLACDGKLWRTFLKKEQPSILYWLLLSYYAFVSVVALCGGVSLFIIFTDVASEMSASFPPWFQEIFFAVVAVIILVPIVETVLIYLRWPPVYWFMVALASLNMLLALGVMAVSFSAPSFLELGTAIVPLVILFLVQEDFMQNHERILCAPDLGVHTHSEFFIRGRNYVRQKMWALAVVHYRRAAAGAPGIVGYHLALATTYAKLKRYDRAQSVLAGAEKIAPDNPDVHELSDLIATARARV
jgi:tetratricopeptide (TPR) repeat protein